MNLIICVKHELLQLYPFAINAVAKRPVPHVGLFNSHNLTGHSLNDIHRHYGCKTRLNTVYITVSFSIKTSNWLRPSFLVRSQRTRMPSS